MGKSEGTEKAKEGRKCRKEVQEGRKERGRRERRKEGRREGQKKEGSRKGTEGRKEEKEE